jgi:diadenosine tetraphosphate (Ap4A) HIT family hydrolase
MSGAFILDLRLAVDSEPVLTLALSDVRLMNDARFPWLIMVPRRMGKVEIIDLDVADRALLMEEITAVSRALKAATGCHKLNVGALGNIVRQLHVHVVGRQTGDAAWPNPVWGVGKSVPYRPDERNRLIELIRTALPT